MHLPWMDMVWVSGGVQGTEWPSGSSGVCWVVLGQATETVYPMHMGLGAAVCVIMHTFMS